MSEVSYIVTYAILDTHKEFNNSVTDDEILGFYGNRNKH